MTSNSFQFAFWILFYFVYCLGLIKTINVIQNNSKGKCFEHRANARNVRLYYPYWQYTDLFIFDLYLYSAYAAHYVYY